MYDNTYRSRHIGATTLHYHLAHRPDTAVLLYPLLRSLR